VTELGPLVGIGRTAEVFAFGEGRVVKLLRPGFPDRLAEDEARVARAVAAVYPEAPACDGLVRIKGRLGVVLERLDGPSMETRARAGLWEVDRLARQLAALHAEMHASDGSGLPDQRDATHAAIARVESILPPGAAAAAHERLDRLASGTSLCHGDLHPANVLLGRRTVVIDWLTARCGSPAGDVARSVFLMRDAAMIDSTPRLARIAIQAVRGRFCRVYLATYRSLRAIDPEEIRAWRLPTLAARLAEGITAERPALVAEIEREVAR